MSDNMDEDFCCEIDTLCARSKKQREQAISLFGLTGVQLREATRRLEYRRAMLKRFIELKAPRAILETAKRDVAEGEKALLEAMWEDAK